MSEEKDREALSQSREATKSLERIRNHLKNDLNRISRTEEVLKRDKEIFQIVANKQEQIESETRKSDKLIKSIDRKQRKTKILADIGFYIFVITLIYLFSKRIPPFIFQYILQILNTMFGLIGASFNFDKPIQVSSNPNGLINNDEADAYFSQVSSSIIDFFSSFTKTISPFSRETEQVNFFSFQAVLNYFKSLYG